MSGLEGILIMCGFLFAGGVEHQACQTALDLIDYRGPDSSGSCIESGYFFGHKRLTILDLTEAGNQPKYSRSGKHLIVYNGEIYNFQELASRFSITLTSHCDTELLVELYEKIGLKMLDELNGMFAFVMLNCESGEFVVARDRLGIKPIYYSKQEGKQLFCSELAPIKSLLDHISLDDVAVRQYKKLRTFFRGHTIWNEIKMFPAGHYYDSATGMFTPYWALSDEDQPPPSDEELYDLLRSSVNYRMIADVPVGCFLSGGLDSSIVASLMQRVETWGVGSQNNNEFEWSQQVADFLDVPHNKIIVDPARYRKVMEDMVHARQEPLSVPNEVMIYLMSRQAKKKNTVVLGGEGADELFFGYDRIFNWANQSAWSIDMFDMHYSYSKGSDMEILEYVLEPYLVESKSALKTVSRFFQLAHLHGLLRRVDFATMFASVEARVPFVDHRLVERMAGVPFDYRMKNGVVKAPLKRAFGSLVPMGIIERKKVGFPVNLEDMLGIDGAGYEEFLDLNLGLLER